MVTMRKFIDITKDGTSEVDGVKVTVEGGSVRITATDGSTVSNITVGPPEVETQSQITGSHHVRPDWGMVVAGLALAGALLYILRAMGHL